MIQDKDNEEKMSGSTTVTPLGVSCCRLIPPKGVTVEFLDCINHSSNIISLCYFYGALITVEAKHRPQAILPVALACESGISCRFLSRSSQPAL